jgi:hypothetical protein
MYISRNAVSQSMLFLILIVVIGISVCIIDFPAVVIDVDEGGVFEEIYVSDFHIDNIDSRSVLKVLEQFIAFVRVNQLDFFVNYLLGGYMF